MSIPTLERRIGLVLAVATVGSIAVTTAGVVAMAGSGIDPLRHPYPAFDAARLGDDLAAMRPEGFLWAGLVAVILTPLARVFASLAGYAAAGDRRQAALAAAVLAVVGLGVLLGLGG
jgi:uncharacterized membrane protein